MLIDRSIDDGRSTARSIASFECSRSPSFVARSVAFVPERFDERFVRRRTRRGQMSTRMSSSLETSTSGEGRRAGGSARARARARPSARRRLERDYDDVSTSRGREQSPFERSGGLLYVRQFLPSDVFAEVVKACEGLRERVTAENRACARDRLGVMVPSDNFVHHAFVAREVADKLRELLHGTDRDRELFPGDVPVEYRIYPVGGSMDWHKDVALYTKPQYEIVFTVANTSDSTTEWEDERTGMRYGGWTEPNSIIVVKADGAAHRVTPITVGERSIIKFVLTETLEKTEDFFDNLLTYAK